MQRSSTMRRSPSCMPKTHAYARVSGMHGALARRKQVVASSAGASSINVHQSAVDVMRKHWPGFQRRVSGEWQGTSTTFTPDGTPEQLPEHYVPQAYRDWSVELFDWQTQCSSLATDTAFQVTSRKLMPTVGCEADAVAFNEEGVKLWSAEEGPAVLPVLPGGSYSHGPEQLPSSSNRFLLESCLQEAGEGDSSSRVRVVHSIMRHWQSKQWCVSGMDVYKDKWDGPYRGKRELIACGYDDKGFGQQEALAVAQLQGSWQVVSGVQYSSSAAGGSTAVELPEGQALAVLADGAVGLPLGVWSRVEVQGESVAVEAGRILEDGQLLYVRRSYVDGCLSEVLLANARKP